MSQDETLRDLERRALAGDDDARREWHEALCRAGLAMRIETPPSTTMGRFFVGEAVRFEWSGLLAYVLGVHDSWIVVGCGPSPRDGEPVVGLASGARRLPAFIGAPDRVDSLPNGALRVIDYKTATGSRPSRVF